MARPQAGIRLVLASAFLASLHAAAGQVPSVRPATLSPLAIDVAATGRDMRGADALGPQDFVVTVDGQPRRVLAVRYVSRGPGAAGTAAARQSNGTGISYAAEPGRTVLVVIDETMLPRGEERTAILAVGAFLDRLGLEDRVAIVRLPLASRTPLAFTTERPATREALRAVAGQATTGDAIATGEKVNPADVDRGGGGIRTARTPAIRTAE